MSGSTFLRVQVGDMSVSLDKALTIARAKAFDEGGGIVIDRKNKRARSRHENDGEEDDMDLKNRENTKPGAKAAGDAAFWKQKYNKVKKLREEAEEDLEEQLRVSKEKEVALEKYANLLQQKIKAIEKGGVNDTGSDVEELREKVESQRKYLSFYELMTSMTVKEEEDGIMVCTLKNRVKRNATRFMIENSNNDEIDYIPRGNINLLPDYLQQEMTCERNMAPIVLADAVQALYDDE